MRSTTAAALLLIVLSATTNALSISKSNAKGLIGSRSIPLFDENDVKIIDEQLLSDEMESIDGGEWPGREDSVSEQTLEKRRGGGRGGGGGGRSSGSGGRSGSTGIGGSRSNTGGRTTTGSGTSKGTGGYYGGGGAVPFTSGQRSASGLLPLLLSLSLVSLFFAGAWLYGSIFSYQFDREVSYHNVTSNRNESLPVICLCQEYSVCGCDENHNQTYIDALVANATAAAGDGIITSKITDVNGTRTLVINGTLENGTTADGGTEEVSGAAKMAELVGKSAGMLTLVAVVVAGILSM